MREIEQLLPLKENPLTTILEQYLSNDLPDPDLQVLVDHPKLLETLRSSPFLSHRRFLRLKAAFRKADATQRQALHSRLMSMPSTHLGESEREELVFMQTLGSLATTAESLSFIIDSEKPQVLASNNETKPE